MLKIGLTGGIGSGKSVVAEIFRIPGIKIFQADEVARSLYDRKDILDKIKDIFGEGIFTPEGLLDRKSLAKLVFSERDALIKLNDLIHPLVRKSFEDFSNRNLTEKYIIYEAAILFETGHYKNLDRNILVMAPEELRISRVMQRDGEERENVIRRMENQWKDEQKKALADYIILNDGNSSLIRQVLKIHEDLISTIK